MFLKLTSFGKPVRINLAVVSYIFVNCDGMVRFEFIDRDWQLVDQSLDEVDAAVEVMVQRMTYMPVSTSIPNLD